MSLPVIFKPVIIDKISQELCGLQGSHWIGHWADGGLFDNAPVEAFGKPENTILLRLGPRQLDKKIDSFFSYLLTWMMVGMVEGGAGHVTKTTFNYSHIIELFVGEIGLLDFQLKPEQFEDIATRNYKIVKDMF
jgi:predicted acylesterase/phospholipase RssA